MPDSFPVDTAIGSWSPSGETGSLHAHRQDLQRHLRESRPAGNATEHPIEIYREPGRPDVTVGNSAGILITPVGSESRIHRLRNRIERTSGSYQTYAIVALRVEDEDVWVELQDEHAASDSSEGGAEYRFHAFDIEPRETPGSDTNYGRSRRGDQPWIQTDTILAAAAVSSAVSIFLMNDLTSNGVLNLLAILGSTVALTTVSLVMMSIQRELIGAA
jgi:hypothetical protein